MDTPGARSASSARPNNRHYYRARHYDDLNLEIRRLRRKAHILQQGYKSSLSFRGAVILKLARGLSA